MTEREAKKVLGRFDEAAQEYAFMGAQEPVMAMEVEKEYEAAKQALWVLLLKGVK